MNNFKKIFACVLCAFLALFMFSCGDNKEVVNENEIKLVELNGKTIETIPESIRNYLNLKTEKEQLLYLYNNKDIHNYQNDFRLEWKESKGGRFKVHFSLNENFSDEIVIDSIKPYIVDCSKLLRGKKYFWRVTDDMDCISKVDSFVLDDKPLRIYNVEKCDNIRDIGGWKTESGKAVKHGMVFRGGKINALTLDGIDFFKNTLDIKTELDLRSSKDDAGQSSCAFDASRNYIQVALRPYTEIMPNFNQSEPSVRSYDVETPEKLKAIFSTFANIDNYPIYFHCNAGADRTGTIAFLLNGLLGVPYEELVKDFEITSFSGYGLRWRGDIAPDGTLISDVMRDDKTNYVAFNKLCNMLNKDYGVTGGTFKDTIENYLKTVAGVTDEEISNIRNILL